MPDHRPLSIAPMMDWTDRHFRYCFRGISRRVWLYTEMITTGAILHGDRERILAFDPLEKPLSLQLGGDDAQALAQCAAIGAEYGYDEINLNVGCPSDRVQHGNFGACLMATPERVADMIAAMQAQSSVDVTVKCRIGIEGRAEYDHLAEFVNTVSQAGCGRFTVHARIAILSGLSTKANRSVPPLRYADVHRLKKDFPELRIEINGGIRTLDAAREQLQYVDGAMIGRAAYEDSFCFAAADGSFYGDRAEMPTRRQVIEHCQRYLLEEVRRGTRPHAITRHLMGLFHQVPGARTWRRTLSSVPRRSNVDDLFADAMAQIPADILDAGIDAPLVC
ncbi:MAG: tRNA dihydrouridine(20/20a) synthase DusA [Leptospiraceae bacterium]|nr:tRNA dihydrouridine(20/20a) synthase DusA [Leptospiraceae bacterium]MCB1322054.1 tRNA dihydrouridine(20/20a) synthase DusA [Leptospiraceae bacterium]